MASQIRTKVVISAALIVVILASVASVGTTEAEDDEVSGLMIDFGYWDVDWIEMSFPEGMDGYSALRTACEMEGYEVRFRDSGELYSIDGQADLEGLSWAMYVLDEGGQWAEGDPDGDISGERLVCFARSSGASAVVPGTDQSGFTYYSYARDGTSMSTGEPLRVATLAPSVTETVCAVGGLEYIVGTDLYSDYPAEVVEGREDGTIGTTGGYTDPNFEYIISLDPDIVFLDGGSGEQVSMADKLRKAGMDCVILYNCTDINTLYDNLWIAASALGLSENANAQINAIRHTINTVSGRVGASLESIGNGAFYGCESLGSLVLPESLISMGDRAFAYCSSLSDVYFHGSMPEFGRSVFLNIHPLIHYLPEYAESWASYDGDAVEDAVDGEGSSWTVPVAVIVVATIAVLALIVLIRRRSS